MVVRALEPSIEQPNTRPTLADTTPTRALHDTSLTRALDISPTRALNVQV